MPVAQLSKQFGQLNFDKCVCIVFRLMCVHMDFFFCSPPNTSSSVTMQLAELSSRVDNMEISIKKDIKCILEILQQTSGRGKLLETLHGSEQHQTKEQMAQDKQTLLMTSSIQPSESDFSFELCLDTKRASQAPHLHRMPTAGTSQVHPVHRSISQPECTNTATEKNLLRYGFGAYLFGKYAH